MTTERLSRSERAAELLALLEELRAAGTPSWPADFARRAGITKSHLSSFEIYPEVSDYGWATSPSKMRGKAPRARRGSRSAGSATRRLQSRLSEAARALAAAAEREAEVRSANRTSVELLETRVAHLERLLEALILRAVEAGVDVRDIEAILGANCPSMG